MEGISVIICCYNSAWVISRTLKCLIKQENIANINYQIIVVDNNSTDDTTRIVLDYIKTYVDVDIKLFYEKRQGLIYARECGISQSKYSYLLFCDDDNLLCEYYVSTVYEEMEENPSLGACGGYGIAEFYNCVEPEWFKLVASGYAIGKQNAANNYLYGASCCYRKSALEKLYAIGFKPILTGRKGNVLLAGDDGELAMGILLMSYTLKAIDRVNFVHVLPASRLNLNYLYRMVEGFGLCSLPIYMYRNLLKGRIPTKYILYLRYFFFLLLLTLCHFKLIFYPNSVSFKVKYFKYIGILKSYKLFSLSVLLLNFQKLRGSLDKT